MAFLKLSVATAAGSTASALRSKIGFRRHPAEFERPAHIGRDHALDFLKGIAGFGKCLNRRITQHIAAHGLKAVGFLFTDLLTGLLLLMQRFPQIREGGIATGGLRILQEALDPVAGVDDAFVLKQGFAEFTDLLSEVEPRLNVVVSTNDKHAAFVLPRLPLANRHFDPV